MQLYLIFLLLWKLIFFHVTEFLSWKTLSILYTPSFCQWLYNIILQGHILFLPETSWSYQPLICYNLIAFYVALPDLWPLLFIIVTWPVHFFSKSLHKLWNSWCRTCGYDRPDLTHKILFFLPFTWTMWTTYPVVRQWGQAKPNIMLKYSFQGRGGDLKKPILMSLFSDTSSWQ